MMTQRALFDEKSPARTPRFNGSDYVPARDDARLVGQMRRVFDVMKDGHWRTLAAISEMTGDPQTSVSAQLRHLRKARFGGHTIEKEYVGGGLFWYRMEVNPKAKGGSR